MEPQKLYSSKATRPTNEQFQEMAKKYGFHFTEDEAKELQIELDKNLAFCDQLLQLPDPMPVIKYPRTPGYFPSPSENKLNAWYVKTRIEGAPKGKLSGKTIVLKDNVALAGVPMMNGSSILEGYTPEVDATIVTRILDAGGTIVGKAHCENFCISGGSFTGAKGPVHNPYKYGYMSGGSSSGSAVLVASGEVDMAIGGDQGGSIRIPASWCGCYGMKPTHGLVPYTGIGSIEITIDHAGPMTANVSDNALFLEVLAGSDGLDPRQKIPKSIATDYTATLMEGVKGFKIGVLNEGLALPNSDKQVSAYILQAADRFKTLGATVTNISIPEHSLGGLAFNGIITEGTLQTMLLGNGYGTGHKGYYLTSLMKAQSRWKAHPDELSLTTKALALGGEFLSKQYDGLIYAKAQNLNLKIKQCYDEKFKEYDIIIMPTLPYTAPPLPQKDVNMNTYIQTALGMVGNTMVFNCTGHPAMSIPVGMYDDLPVGMMLVSKYFNEAVIYRAAYAWEKANNWKDIKSA